ncbi:MAG TPA: LamG-like jellyroll fold domain-containing protein [Nitrospiria bacterium]|jgi:hypothetical protein
MREQRVKYFTLSTLYLVVLFVLLLSPFDLHLPILKSEIQWLEQSRGMEIRGTAGIRSSSSAEKLYNAMKTGSGITLEFWITTKHLNQKGPARIISYSANKVRRNFTIGQEGRDLIVRLRTTKTNLNGKNPEWRVEDVLDSNHPQHIAVTYDFFKEKIYVDGQLRDSSTALSGDFSNWNPTFPLLIGNEGTGNRPWVGKIFLVALYNRALSEQEVVQNYRAESLKGIPGNGPSGRVMDGITTLYLFDQRKGEVIMDKSGVKPFIQTQILTGPEITNQVFLMHPFQNFNLSWKQLTDILINIVLFIPLGYLAYAATVFANNDSGIKMVSVLILGVFFSLCMEYLQYYSLVRISSLMDVINNGIGTFLGIIIQRFRTVST